MACFIIAGESVKRGSIALIEDQHRWLKRSMMVCPSLHMLFALLQLLIELKLQLELWCRSEVNQVSVATGSLQYPYHLCKANTSSMNRR